MDTVALNALLDALGRLPGWVIWGYFWANILTMRSVGLHWVLWMALWVLESVRMPVAAAGTPEAVAYFAVQIAVYPLAMSCDGIGYRLLVMASTAVVSLMAEMITTLFASAVGIVVAEDFRSVLDHPFEYAVCQAFITVLFLLLFYLLHETLRRIAGRRVNPALPYFGAGLFAQFAMTATMLAVAEFFAWGNAVVIGATCAFVLVNIVADALILLSVARADEAYRQSMRAEALRSRLDACLAHFRGLADEVQSVARFRHDLRDGLQAVAALVRQGDYARAEGLVGELEARLGEGRASEGDAR